MQPYQKNKIKRIKENDNSYYDGDSIHSDIHYYYC